MAEDDIVQKVIIEVDDTALSKVGDNAKQSFGQLQQASDSSSQSIGKFGEAAAQTGNKFSQLTKESGVTRGELRELSIILRSFGLGEVGQLAAHFGKIGVSLGLLGVAALAAGYGLKELFNIATEAKDAADAVENLSKAVADTPAALSNLQGALAESGVKAKDFETAFDALAQKVTEGAARMGEAFAESEKKIADAELAAAKAAQAVSSNPKAYEQQIKTLEAAQKTSAAWVAGEKAADAYANSLSGVTRQLEGMADGYKGTLNSLTSTKTVAEALIVVLAKNATSVKDFGNGMSGLTLNAQKAADEINKLYNNADDLTKLKIKDALKIDGVPDSVIKSLTQTVDKYNELKKTAEDKAWERDALGELGLAIEKSKEQLGGWGTTFGAVFAVGLQWVGKLEHAIVDLVTAAPADAWQWIKDTWNELGKWFNDEIQKAKDLVKEWVTTPIAEAWQWIIDAWNNMVNSLFGGSSGGASPAATGGGGEGMALGGVVTGRGGIDTIPALLTRGEYVINAAAVQRVGVGFLHSVNALQTTPRFALGGLVGAGTGSPASSRSLHITFDGRTFGPMSAPEGVAASLERFAVHSQLASIGRSQSWRK